MTGGFYGLGPQGRRVLARMARTLLLSAPVLIVPASSAQTLTQAWEQALAAEPALQAARAGHRAAGERTRQARGALLPQIEASYNRQKNHRDFVQTPQGEEPGPGTSEQYPSRVAQVNVTQPLWRPVSWAALAQARESEQQAFYQAFATEQDLQTRFLVAWFDAMAARDNVRHGDEQVEATRQQQLVMQRGLALGTHNEVQASEAEARFQQALADRTAAAAELEGKLALLEQLTGPLPGYAPPTLAAAPAGPWFTGLEPLAAWLARLHTDNPAIRAAERALAAAREEVRRQQALHQPTVDLVAKRSNNLQGSGNSPGQSGYRSREESIGVQVNVPLFSGGTTVAKVREAQALADKAEYDLDSARRNAVAQAQQAWAALRATQARAQAAEHGIRAGEIALRAALTGQGSGVKTPLDELQARQQIAAARRDQQRAHYDRVVAVARLRGAAGQPGDVFLPEVEKLLSPVPAPWPGSTVSR